MAFRAKSLLIVIALIEACSPLQVLSSGFVLDKEYVVLQDILVGKSIGIGRLLPRIRNTGNDSAILSVAFRRSLKCKLGYESIPGPSWFEPRELRISLPPGREVALSNLYLNVPYERRFSGQRFEVSLELKMEGEIAIEMSVPIWIETSGEAQETPRGYFGFLPTKLDFHGDDDKAQQSLVVYNGHADKTEVVVFLAFPPEKSGAFILPPSPGYEWLSKGECIKLTAAGKKISDHRWEVELAAGQAREINVELKCVKEDLRGREAILVAVRRGSSKWHFARVRMAP